MTVSVRRSLQLSAGLCVLGLGLLLWGWPHRFVARMHDPASFDERVPDHFDGYVWTNRIELIGPHLRARSAD